MAVHPFSRRVVDQVRRLAPSSSTVLVRGEDGVGKDLVASMLHYVGPHRSDGIVRIDCAGLPADLIERELFGEDASRRGRLEVPGTVVLDEVAALSMPMQARLLRVLEQREFDRNGGGERPIKVNARLLVLTSVDLERAVARRAFREDLYYRLSVVQLHVAPLRERNEDIPALAEHFLAQLASVHRRAKSSLSANALRLLMKYSYPGNVRQLRSVLERAMQNSTGPEIQEDDLPSFVREANGRPLMSLEELEREYISEVLTATEGRKSKAAEILGISRKTLLEKRKKYGLE